MELYGPNERAVVDAFDLSRALDDSFWSAVINVKTSTTDINVVSKMATFLRMAPSLRKLLLRETDEFALEIEEPSKKGKQRVSDTMKFEILIR